MPSLSQRGPTSTLSSSRAVTSRKRPERAKRWQSYGDGTYFQSSLEKNKLNTESFLNSCKNSNQQATSFLEIFPEKERKESNL